MYKRPYARICVDSSKHFGCVYMYGVRSVNPALGGVGQNDVVRRDNFCTAIATRRATAKLHDVSITDTRRIHNRERAFSGHAHV